MAARQPDRKSRLAIALFFAPTRMADAPKSETGKRNEDGGEPHFIGTSIEDLVRDPLETYP
jgi:hypothetical protein